MMMMMMMMMIKFIECNFPYKMIKCALHKLCERITGNVKLSITMIIKT